MQEREIHEAERADVAAFRRKLDQDRRASLAFRLQQHVYIYDNCICMLT